MAQEAKVCPSAFRMPQRQPFPAQLWEEAEVSFTVHPGWSQEEVNPLSRDQHCKQTSARVDLAQNNPRYPQGTLAAPSHLSRFHLLSPVEGWLPSLRQPHSRSVLGPLARQSEGKGEAQEILWPPQARGPKPKA